MHNDTTISKHKMKQIGWMALKSIQENTDVKGTKNSAYTNIGINISFESKTRYDIKTIAKIVWIVINFIFLKLLSRESTIIEEKYIIE